MNYSLTQYSTFELSLMRESNQMHINELEAFNKRVKGLGRDMENLAADRVDQNKKKLSALYDQRVHILTAFDVVKRLETVGAN